MRYAMLVVMVCGCGEAVTQGITALEDLGAGDLVIMTPEDGPAPPQMDFAQQDLRTSPPPVDLRMPSSADMIRTPDMLVICPGGMPGLPLGATCANNLECCNGLCYTTTTSGTGHQCCQSSGTNCIAGAVCCSQYFGDPRQGVCGTTSGLCE